MASHKQNGFSLLELVIAISVALILGSAVTVTMQTTFKQQLVNDAYNTTLTTLRRARDQAAADMRVYVVTFGAATAGNGGTITVTQSTRSGHGVDDLLSAAASYLSSGAGHTEHGSHDSGRFRYGDEGI